MQWGCQQRLGAEQHLCSITCPTPWELQQCESGCCVSAEQGVHGGPPESPLLNSSESMFSIIISRIEEAHCHLENAIDTEHLHYPLFPQDISGNSCTSTQTVHTVPLGKEVSQGTHGKKRYPDTVEEKQINLVRLKLARIFVWGTWWSLRVWSFEQKLFLRLSGSEPCQLTHLRYPCLIFCT